MAARAFPRPCPQPRRGAAHRHVHSHEPLGADGTRVGLRSLVAIGVSGGLVPCPAALVLLLGAISLGRLGTQARPMRFPKSVGVAGLLGALGGIWVGSRSVNIYDWLTEWTIPAPLPIVYEAMTSREAGRQWWPDMELVDDTGGDELRVGSTVSFRVHQAPEVARLAPPFQIHCLYTDVEPQRRLKETVEGDLSGVLKTLFDEQENGTRITFSWYVRVTNPALNILGYVAERIYRHSHDHVMESGEKGLSEYGLRLASSEGARSG